MRHNSWRDQIQWATKSDTNYAISTEIYARTHFIKKTHHDSGGFEKTKRWVVKLTGILNISSIRDSGDFPFFGRTNKKICFKSEHEYKSFSIKTYTNKKTRLHYTVHIQYNWMKYPKEFTRIAYALCNFFHTEIRFSMKKMLVEMKQPCEITLPMKPDPPVMKIVLPL